MKIWVHWIISDSVSAFVDWVNALQIKSEWRQILPNLSGTNNLRKVKN